VSCSLVEITNVFRNLHIPSSGWNGIRHTVFNLFCHLIDWAKCKYTELVVDASIEVGLEENVEKTEVYFMSCNQIAGQYCNKND